MIGQRRRRDEPPRALVEAVAEVDRHLRSGGWDQPTRLYALVRTADLVASEPALAQTLGLPQSPDIDALTPVEQESCRLARRSRVAGEIGWPPEVAGCALSQEVLTLPPSVEADLPADADAVAWASLTRCVVRSGMVVGVLRELRTSEPSSSRRDGPIGRRGDRRQTWCRF